MLDFHSVTNICQPLALISEILRSLDRTGIALELLCKGGNGGRFTQIFNVPVIYNPRLNGRVIYKCNGAPKGYMAGTEAKRPAAGSLPHLIGDPLIQNFMPLRGHPFQAVQRAADFSDTLQQPISPSADMA